MAACEGFSHLVLPVADLERSEKFYREVFGLEPLGRNLVAEREPNAILKSDCRQLVVLVEQPAREVRIEREGANSTHHAWLVNTPEEYQAVRKRLEDMGFDIADYRAAFRAAGEYSIDLVDPDGHRWQIQAQGPEATDIRITKAGVVNCGAMTDYEIGAVKLYEKERFFLLRTRTGFLALSQWCTHRNGLVKWRPYFHDFHCFKHGATFSRMGKAVSPIMRLPPLRLHPVSVNDRGEVEVDTDRVVLRRDYDPAQVLPPMCGSRLELDKLKFTKEVV